MFITLEGVDGSGKTTQIKHMTKFLDFWGINHVVSHEPGGTAIGKQIRTALLNSRNTDIDSITELLLYLADRVQHIKDVIQPGIDSSAVVLCDRYVDSTIVYQGFARGLNVSDIFYLHDKLCKGLMPDITLLMDIDPHVSLLRTQKRLNNLSDSNNLRFEQESINFHIKVRNGYLELAKSDSERFHVIDAELEEIEIKKQIETVLEKQLLSI